MSYMSDNTPYEHRKTDDHNLFTPDPKHNSVNVAELQQKNAELTMRVKQLETELQDYNKIKIINDIKRVLMTEIFHEDDEELATDAAHYILQHFNVTLK